MRQPSELRRLGRTRLGFVVTKNSLDDRRGQTVAIFGTGKQAGVERIAQKTAFHQDSRRANMANDVKIARLDAAIIRLRACEERRLNVSSQCFVVGDFRIHGRVEETCPRPLIARRNLLMRIKDRDACGGREWRLVEMQTDEQGMFVLVGYGRALFERDGRLIVATGEDCLEPEGLEQSFGPKSQVEGQFLFDEPVGSGAIVDTAVTWIEDDGGENVQRGGDAVIQGGLGVGSDDKCQASRKDHNSHTWHGVLHPPNFAQSGPPAKSSVRPPFSRVTPLCLAAPSLNVGVDELPHRAENAM